MNGERPIDGTLAPSDEEVLSAYLFDDLDPGERDRMQRRLARDGALRAQEQRLAPLVRQLEHLSQDAWAFVATQPGADAAPSDDLTTTRAPAPRRRWWHGRLSVRPALAAMTAVALLAIGVGVGVLLSRTPGVSGATVVLRALPGEPTSAVARGRLTPDGHIVLMISHLPASRPGTYYEAWLMTSTTRLVPVAAFRSGTDGRARLDVPLPAAAAAYRYIDISLQRTGAGTAHSHDSVLRGNT